MKLLVCFQCNRGYRPLDDGGMERDVRAPPPKPKMNYHKYTPEEDALILQDVANKQGLAALFGVTPESIERRRDRLSAKTRQANQWGESEAGRLRAMVEDWWTHTEMAASFGVTMPALRKGLETHGLLYVPEDYITTEPEFQKEVIEFAQERGWQFYHANESRRDEPGFPDLVLWRERLMFRELKVGRRILESRQRDTMRAMRGAGADVGLWRPPDLATKIRRELW